MTFGERAYRWLALITFSVLGVGTIFYHHVENLNWIDSYYFSFITLTTVGYGDITPKTDEGKLFTTLYLAIGIGIITAFITTTAKRNGERIVKKHSKSVESKKK